MTLTAPPARSTPAPLKATLADVARAAGVSTATVSRCLNATAAVSEPVRQRVQDAIDQLGYTPNFSARALAERRTRTIGAIIPTMENAIFARGLQAFQETLNDNGYTLLVSSTAYKPDQEAEQITSMIARGADGLLLIGYERAPKVYEALAQRQIPYLASWVHRPDGPCPAVGFDNRQAMAALAAHVISLGHTAIGVISGIVSGNDRAKDRVAGIKDALVAAGLDTDPLPFAETPYGVSNGGKAFEHLIQTHPQLTAIMCINDVLAVGAIQRAQELGLDVPRQVSVTGFDDIELARVVTPKLTTVHVPHAEMGRRAATELLRMVEGQTPGQSQELLSRLQLRESLRAPSA